MEYIILGVTRGSVYALVAVGFVLVFSVGGILNLAHGTFFMLGAYFTYIYFNFVFGQAGAAAVIASAICAIMSVVAAGLLIFYVLFRRRLTSTSYIMVISLAFALFVEEVAKAFFGVTSTSVPPLIRGSTSLLGVHILNKELLMLPVSFCAILVLQLFLNRSRFGQAIKAVAQCRDGAVLVGIQPERVLAVTIAISAGLAALAGTLVSSLVTVAPGVWSYWLIKAFAIAIVGGLGSLPGAIVAAFLLSFVEVSTTFVLTDQYGELVALFVIALILLFRPVGILGSSRT